MYRVPLKKGEEESKLEESIVLSNKNWENDSLFVILSSFFITQYKYWILLDFLIFFGLPLFTLTSFMIFFGRPLFTSTLGYALIFWDSSFLGLPLFFTPEISCWIVFCKIFFFLPLFFFSRLLFFNFLA